MAAGRHREVVEVLTSPLARQGGLTASLHFSLGLAQMQLKQFPAASEQLRQCLARRDRPGLAPVNPEIRRAGPHHCLALCLAQTGDHAGAEREFQLALQDGPDSIPARLDHARFLQDRGRPVEALQALHQLVGTHPTLAPAWHAGGVIALAKPEFLEVAGDWTAEARRHLPDDPILRAQRAEALLLSGQLEAALPLWRELEPQARPAGLAALVVCETALGHPEYQPPSELAGPVTDEFVRWYRRLLEFGAEPVVRGLNDHVTGLARVLPPAARLLTAALAEATAAA
jgi:tetratricopeptide (TPR) repeat protein